MFGPDPTSAPVKSPGRAEETMEVLITVKAAPNPSETYGETVCVAGIRIDVHPTCWVRLYPINYRELERENTFRKYDIISLRARPAHADPRVESYRPIVETVQTLSYLDTWERRKVFVIDHVQASMCELLSEIRERPLARSLAAIRPRVVKNLEIKAHPGWSAAEQRKIDRYIQQEELFSSGPRTALEAPRFQGWYHYLCQSPPCRGHRQGIYDWEWVALQRNLRRFSDAEAKEQLRLKFFEQMCGPRQDTIFYVGNLAKHPQAFMTLGAFYPKR
ncbi:hypothetical protein [Actinomadura macrotermitis]|uniref:hypothetical protein n=1 Tax=Actinomadura macrotermitis TaxID=2585200 RepID=UPI0018865D7F|nr:hypothetical protein [Actinomadura macrotermitis]